MKRFYAALVLLDFVNICVHILSRLHPMRISLRQIAEQLTVFDTVKNKKVTTIDVGGETHIAITMSPDGRKAYVASYSNLPSLARMDIGS